MLKLAGQKVAIITGITGQAGSYLADLLLSKGYAVHGVLRTPGQFGQAAHLSQRITWHPICLEDYAQVLNLIERVQPDEYYNLAAVSFVPRSIECPLETMSVTGMATVYALEAIRQTKMPVRFFQAGSSEMFGNVREAPQNEDTAFRPQNPYATAKVLAHNTVQNFRTHYGIFACNGILYNHESPRRSLEFVTRKITSSVARIACGLQSHLVLGNLYVQRDWGYAADFAEALWRMLQQPEPDDYVIGTGKLTSLKQLIEIAFEAVGLSWEDRVVVDPKFVRPAEQVCRVADISRARMKMDWSPTTPLETWFREMIQHDLTLAQAEAQGTRTKAA